MATNKDKIRASAQKYLQKGQIDKAIREFEKLIADDPKDVRTLLKIGDLQTRSGKHQEATETYAKVAEFYSDQGFFLKAVAVYKQILKIDPTLIDTNLKLAELYHQLGLLSDASNQYRQISQMYEKQGNIEESIKVLKRMVELDPENIASRIKLAEIYAKQGMSADARDEFRAASEYLKQHHRVDDYIKVAERIVHFDPNDLEVTRELANIYVQKGDARRALAKLQICFKADPNDAETLGLLANAFRELGQIPKTVSVYREMARVHKQNGNTDGFLGAMRKILEVAPDDQAAKAAVAEAQTASATAPAGEVPVIAAAPEPNELDEAELDSDVDAELDELEDALDAAAAAVPAAAAAPAAVASAPDAGMSQTEETVLRILTEVDVYVKYGLKNKAAEHIQRVFEIDPNHRAGHESHKNLLVEMGETEAAVNKLLRMARAAYKGGDATQAQRDVQEALSLAPAHAQATKMLQQLGGSLPEAPEPESEQLTDEIELEAEVEVETDEIELEAEVDLDEIDLDGEIAVHVDEDELEAGVVAEDEPAAPLTYEPSPAAAEIDLDEGFSEPAVEIAAALADEPLEIGEEPEAKVVSGEGAVQLARPRPSESMGAQAHQVYSAETISESGSSAVDIGGPTAEAPPFVEVAAPAPAPAPEPAAAVSPVVDDDLDALLSSVPKRQPAPPPAADAAAAAPAPEPAIDVEAAPAPPLPAPEPEPAAAVEAEGVDLTDEIEEIEFFLQQGLEEEAQDALEALLFGHPDHPELLALKSELEEAAAVPEAEAAPVEEFPEAPTDVPAATVDDDVEPEPLQLESFDLGAELAEELDAGGGDDDFQVSFTDVFDDFKRGVAETVEESDFQTHYDLGIAYREMGLVDDAVREFMVTLKSSPGHIGAVTMAGICQLELGNTAEALDTFLKGLNSDNVSPEEALALRFEIGQAYEAMGRFGEAKKFFEKVHAMNATFRDVGNRLAEAQRQSDGAGEVISDELDALLNETDAEKSAQQKSDKISYV